MDPLRILVVEDDVVSAILSGMILTGLGHQAVGPVATATEAMRVAGEQRPDVVLMDINLTGSLDGVETAVEIHATLGIPSIFVTSDDSDPTRERARCAAPLAYLVKPLQAPELRNCLEAFISSRGAGPRD